MQQRQRQRQFNETLATLAGWFGERVVVTVSGRENPPVVGQFSGVLECAVDLEAEGENPYGSESIRFELKGDKPVQFYVYRECFCGLDRWVDGVLIHLDKVRLCVERESGR